jgi:hypothetical protein
MAANLAPPIIGIIGEARQKLSSAGRGYDCACAIDRSPGALGVKRQCEVKDLASVRIHAGC